MTTVNQILQQTTRKVVTIGTKATVYHALELMMIADIGALPVVENDVLVGIFSERDYARKCILRGKKSSDTLVAELMSTTIVTVKPEQKIDDCMQYMTTHRIRHLPVVVDDKIIGMVSIGDVVNTIISEQAKVIQQLESYITS